MKRISVLALLMGAGVLFSGCAEETATDNVEKLPMGSGTAAGQAAEAARADADSGERKSVAFVTNQIADFWKIAEAGANDAAKEFDLDVEVVMPPEHGAGQSKARGGLSQGVPV